MKMDKREITVIILKVLVKIVNLSAITLGVAYGLSYFFGFRIDTVALYLSMLLMALGGYTMISGLGLRTNYNYNFQRMYAGVGKSALESEQEMSGSRYKLAATLSVAGFIVFIISSTILSYSHAPLTREEKIDDFEYLYEIIADNHPYLMINQRLNGVDWVGERDAFLAQILDSDDEFTGRVADSSFALDISNILGKLNNPYTRSINQDNFLDFYERYTRLNSDGTFTPWVETLTEERTLIRYGLMLKDLEKGISDQTNRYNLPNYRTGIVEPNEVAYLRIYDMGSDRIEKDRDGLLAFYQEISSYEKLIIDIRGKVNGDDQYWIENIIAPLTKDEIQASNHFFIRGNHTKSVYESIGVGLNPVSQLDRAFMEGLSNELKDDVENFFEYYGVKNMTIKPQSSVGFEGDVYLLIDKEVTASTENFAAFSKDSGFAILVGETTSGNGMSLEPLLLALPNSGMVVRFPGELTINQDGEVAVGKGTAPHFEVNPAIGAPNYSRDEAVQFILNNR